MSQLILTAHSGSHDAGAALFEDYRLLAAVQLERLTRYKCDGRQHPDLAIDEVLSIVGKTRKDVDVAGFVTTPETSMTSSMSRNSGVRAASAITTNRMRWHSYSTPTGMMHFWLPRMRAAIP